MTKLITYLRVLWKNAICEVINAMNVKLDFFGNIAVNLTSQIVWPLISVIIYSVTNGLPGWSLGEFIFFMGTNGLVFGLSAMIVFGMVWDVTRKIDSGEFDMFLVRPLKVLPHMLITNISPWASGEFIGGLLVVIFAVIHYGLKATLGGVLLYIYIIFLGLLVYFGFGCLIVALNFKYYKVSNITEFFFELHRITSYPLNIYNKLIATVFTFIIPLSLANFYPAQAFLGRLTDYGSVILLSASVAIFALISVLILRQGVKNYSSAGG